MFGCGYAALCFFTVCLLSRLDISIRHFMVPIALSILMLAPLPRTIAAMPHRRICQAVTVALAVSCFAPILMAYPYYFPFINSLSFGRPNYYLLNDSNVTWNEGLPGGGAFCAGARLSKIEVGWSSLSHPAIVVPEAQAWDCQAPAENDAGQWVLAII